MTDLLTTVPTLSGVSVTMLRDTILGHLRTSLGKDPGHASVYDWRMAVSHTLRDLIMEPWFAATRRTYGEDRKRVYYLSMEFLIGRMLEDAAINLGLHGMIEEALAGVGPEFRTLIEDEPDAALGNGGLGRLAACFLDSMSTLGCPGYGYGIRYEHGIFRQRFEGGRQVETPEDWLIRRDPWVFERPEAVATVGFRGHVETRGARAVWHPGETVIAEAHDMPVVGWQGRWANTLRLWAARPTTLFDLARFNAGDHTAASEPEALARTLSRVLYPNDGTQAGKELRLKQEYFLTAASIADILRRFRGQHSDLRKLPAHVAIQMNDTHPAIAGPELIRVMVDEEQIPFDEACEVAVQVLGYTNHTLLPEALERWSTWTMGSVLPRHMQIIERIDDWHRRMNPKRPASVSILAHDEVQMGTLAFVTAHRVNGVSALHTDLMRKTVFHDLNALHPDRIVNQTNGITPRRWLALANPPLAKLVTDVVGDGWQADLDKLKGLEPHVTDAGFLGQFAAAKRENKARLADWIAATGGAKVNPDALFDVQVKRIHEYKRQLLNILEAIALWHQIREDPSSAIVPRVKIFGGKSAPGYATAKLIIRLINDVATKVNADPVTRDWLQIVYPANYNVSMAERLVPAADLSEQISTAGTEASGTGNMKFSLNGALTIGTLDGANVEIREHVGAENFFLFGLTAGEVVARRARLGHEKAAIGESQRLRDVLMMLAEGVFSPGEEGRYHALTDMLWHHDHYLVTADFEAYYQAQRAVDRAYTDPADWHRMAALNTARMGFFSSDRTIKGYMSDIWSVPPAI
ncbi:glycogen/starch/alpha-glucan family phosphorylase [Frigidibacter albus]|uniref:Alpha-1,4 glucan phosphorylase n=1 Tax=Frigidibacter albus TaxID=1465486 RepID=A0A6L8VJ59_9RHOB|nr:glycogen/starch/alpha-glucan phosphorylase [Frigidibacter albus]MZQ90418.1 glycogen/starch/alpha-glucan family phosphorylase [Frigidibacter albus]NBE32462.1 glycogen/starch/alpha-glucan family phosphorylase [Frigidibacter albus]GGH59874.1 alpha-1,4 glucan phosphorylase [Frigidibacter albus]